jgi:3-hydroxyisobutyrate dehydrogenase/2-hydroxy-3-oxopropionate reductase
MKLAVNTIIYGLNQALSEGLVLAECAGIDRLTAYKIFACSAIAAPFVHYRREAFERPQDVPVALRLSLAEKDLHLILELAQQLQAPLPQAMSNLAVVEKASSQGFEDHDVSGVAEYLRAQAPAVAERGE